MTVLRQRRLCHASWRREAPLARDGYALGCCITSHSPASALHLAWIARRVPSEISKYRPLLLKSSQVSRLRRTATGWLACSNSKRSPSPRTGLAPIRKCVGQHPCAARCRTGMRQLRTIRIGTQDYVAAPYLLFRSPFAYVTCLQPSSLRLCRATLLNFGSTMEHFAPKMNMPERQSVPLPTQSSIILKPLYGYLKFSDGLMHLYSNNYVRKQRVWQ
jgi:hypothetical protein